MHRFRQAPIQVRLLPITLWVLIAPFPMFIASRISTVALLYVLVASLLVLLVLFLLTFPPEGGDQ